MTTAPEYVAIIGNDRIPTRAIVRERWEKFVKPYVANQATFVEVPQVDREAAIGLDNV
jgi:hypothetical protein